MKKLLAFVCSTVVLFCTEMSYAMPSQAELDNVQPLVNELMGPLVKDFKAKKKLAVEVGDGAVELVAEANSDAAKFVLLKGAVSYYARAKAYDKAADAIESIMELVPDIPPKALYEITSKATASATVKNAPRLVALNKSAQKRAAVAARLASVKAQLRKTPADLKLIRQHAELLAAMGKWEAAFAEFAKLGGEIGKMATVDADAKGDGTELADFWWNYTPTAPEAKDAIRSHAASLYQKALDHGELDGLKRTLAERRIAEISAANSTVILQKSSRPSSKLKQGLVGYWPLDGNAKDASGKGNDGILHDVEPVEDRFGQANKAYRFNDKKYIEVPNSPSLQGLTKNVTICVWVRPMAWWLVKGRGFMIILQKGDQKNRQLQTYCYDGSTYFLESWSREKTSWKTKEWQHFAVTYEYGKVARFYKNGVLNGEAFADKEIVPNNLPLLIGYDPFGGTEYLIGDMDDLRIYNRVLSEQEIQELYNAERP